MNRDLKNKIKIYNNRIKQQIRKANNLSKPSSSIYTNIYSNSKKQYDNIFNSISNYILNNYKQIYLSERWKQIINSKRINRKLRGIEYRKEIETLNIDNYIKGILDDLNTVINNTKKERYLQLRLIENKNKQRIKAFLEEEEIENIIRNSETYEGARKDILDQLDGYLEDGKIVIQTQAGKSIHYTMEYYANMLLRTHVREIQTAATIDAANEVGTDLVEVSVHNTLCPICYSKDTEIYTKNGWILIKDIKEDDIVITYNIKLNKIEWSEIKRKIKGYANELIQFKGKQLNIKVTKNHNMLCQNDYKSRYNKSKYDIKKAENLLNNNYSRFFAGCTTWEGNRIGFDYAEFMGYYLSEGNVYKETDNSYRIIISQSRKVNELKYNKIKNCCERYLKWLPIKDRENGISFNSTKLGKYLIQFGKSYEKYIPDNIMNADKQCIRIFLDAFCLGDGYEKKNKWGKNKSKSYITSSKKMADQITELILKIGKRPTYRLIKTSGKVCKFDNGYYTINHDTYVIYESKNIYLRLKKINKNIIGYNDNVYCIETKKNNIIYIRREGKPIWCGNCIDYEGRIFSLDGKNPLFPPADNLPPYHPHCYSFDTEIYTKNGWILIKDIKEDDFCLSLNPNTFNLEYKKVIKVHKHFEDKMLLFKNKIADICVTQDHSMFYQTDWNSKKNKNKFQFIKAKELLLKKSGRFYASSEWKGENSLNKDYCEFMGYYLSEGYVEKIETKRKDYFYKIIICQSKNKNREKYNKMYECIKKCFPNKHICTLNEGLIFYDKIGEKLYSLGLSFQKYIPNEIKEQEKDNIRIFLDAFCLGDGSQRKKIWGNWNFKNEKVYYTSSKKIMNDLCELLIKVGRRPSVYIHIKKGTRTKFKNGIYESNHDVFRITECYSKYISLQQMKKKIIDYNNFAYCVTLEDNHTLYTKRNGKCIWSGNCLHSITVTFESVLINRGNLDNYIKFSKGESDTHPTAKGWIPISERKIE